MATQTIQHQATTVVPASGKGIWEKVVSFFGSVAHTLEPYFGPANLDYLESDYTSDLSVHERVRGEGYL